MKTILIYLLLFVSIVNAQQSQQPDASEILLALRKLNTIGSVLFIAAHPDDENTRLLAYLSKEKKLRTGYLSITRGDGGQNLVGKEQGDMLGLVRTQELIAARKIDGAEQFFTRANDFGYSKNPEETMSFWNKDSILNDVVWVIRNFKPDIIISRFPATGEGGHGHHTASAILAMEAFEAAADANRFKHQLMETEVWKTKRLFWNTFNFGNTNTTSPDQVQVDIGVFNPLLGNSYGEIAAESRTMHKSQGFGSAKMRGTMIEYFKQLKGDSVKTLFEGIDQSWNRIAGGSTIQKLIGECIQKYNAESPEKIIPDLVAVYNQIQSLPSEKGEIVLWKQLKLQETESLILACSGLWMEAYADNYIGIPGKEVSIHAQIVNRNKSAVNLKGIVFLKTDTLMNMSLNQNELISIRHTEPLTASMPYSNPYWLNERHQQGIYVVKDLSLIGKPENVNRAPVVFFIEVDGLALQIKRELTYKFTDPVKGEIYRPFEILPPATVNVSEKVFVFGDASPKTIQFIVKANTTNVEGRIEASVSAGWNLQMKNNEFKLIQIGDEIILEATVNPVGTKGEGKLSASLHIPDGSTKRVYTKSIVRIEHDHIPYQFILSDAEAKLIHTEIKKAGTNIGYIPGAGDEVPGCLKQIGYRVTTLTDDMIANENLSAYDAIVTGIRAYNTNERLQVYYPKLMDYVKNGGNLVVQYNTNNRIGPLLAKMAPYPFTISRDRTTDETAEVRMIQTTSPALNFPNKITGKDFEGWIQERGIYFAGERDSAYQSIFSMNDRGEKPLDGSLIIAKYGKGNFVYTGLVFFRELPAGIPGAYRLFVNLLSLPRNNK